MLPIKFAPKKGFHEIFQINKISFSWIKPTKTEYVELHSPVLCRDFLNDAVYSYKYKVKFELYNFKWNAQSINITKPHLAITAKDTYRQKLKNNLHLLNKIEEANKLKLSTIVAEEDGTIIITFDKRWLSKCWGCSLYSFLLKAYCLSPNFSLSGSEEEYWNQTKHILHKVLSKNNLIKLLTNTSEWIPEDINTLSMHHRVGFVSQITNKNASYYHVFHNLI